jgi:branched-chain amino acid transport system substrate-binding protein
MIMFVRLLLALAVLSAVSAARAEDIKVGIPGPVTGPIAYLGQHMKWGAELAIEQVNNGGGVLGRKLTLLMQDSSCRPAEGVAAARKLIDQDKVDFLISDICSGSTMALMPVVEAAHMPLIVAASTLPDITQKAGVGGNKWVFRIVPDDIMQAKVIAKKITGIKSIAFVAEDTDYGRGGVRLLKERMDPAVKVLSEDFVKPADTDFLSILTRLRAENPDAIGVYMLDQQALNLMKQYAQFGLKTPLVARPPLISNLVVDLIASGNFDKSWTVYPYYDKYNGAMNTAFVSAFKQRHPEPPHYVAYGAYEAVLAGADAIKRAGTTDSDKVRTALASTNVEQILGPLHFDDHNQAHNKMMFLQVQGNKLVLVDLAGD